MSLRPCKCDNIPKDGKFALGYCRACYLYWFDEEYGSMWGRKPGQQLPTPPERRGISVLPLYRNESTVSPNVSFRASPQQSVDRSLPCLNLGKVVNRSGCNCPMKFIHECEIHQFCHRGSHYSTVASCLTCPDYESDRP